MNKNTLFALWTLVLMAALPLNAENANIKYVFWSKPSLFYQNRMAMFNKLGFFNSLFNAGRASEAQEQFFRKLKKNFGEQTAQYTANDPETNEALPLEMLLWLTGEKSVDTIRKEVLSVLKSDKFLYSIAEVVFTPKSLIDVTSVNKDALDLVKRLKENGITNILASNYDPASWEVLKSSDMGKKVWPYFAHIYNSGNLSAHYRGLILQNPEFLKLILKEVGITNPAECLVVTSDPMVAAAAQAIGMQVLLYPVGDIKTIKKYLKSHNLIKG